MKASEEKKKKMREYAKTHRKQFNEYQRKYINKLKEEGKKPITTLDRYKARIDKAIEYIENNTYEKSDNECGYTYDWNVRDLYNILKGSDIKNGI